MNDKKVTVLVTYTDKLNGVTMVNESTDTFRTELTRLINFYGMDAECSVPDHILADIRDKKIEQEN